MRGDGRLVWVFRIQANDVTRDDRLQVGEVFDVLVARVEHNDDFIKVDGASFVWEADNQRTLDQELERYLEQAGSLRL